MNPAIDQLKHQARLLHRRVSLGDQAALERVHRAMRAMPPRIQRKHCLRALAVEHGFSGWPHAVQVVSGDTVLDFGTTLHPDACSGFLNSWFARRDEALASRDANGGYVLPYRRQFFVVGTDYVRALGLRPDASEWAALGYDWSSPAAPDARARLYGELFTARFERGSGLVSRSGSIVTEVA